MAVPELVTVLWKWGEFFQCVERVRKLAHSTWIARENIAQMMLWQSNTLVLLFPHNEICPKFSGSHFRCTAVIISSVFRTFEIVWHFTQIGWRLKDNSALLQPGSCSFCQLWQHCTHTTDCCEQAYTGNLRVKSHCKEKKKREKICGLSSSFLC